MRRWGTPYCYTLYRAAGPAHCAHSPGGSHRLAFNPFCLWELLGPGEMGAMKTSGWEGESPWPRGHPTWGLHDIALGGPTAILDECQPGLGHCGLARRGLCFLLGSGACSKVGAQRKRGKKGEREKWGKESPDHLQPQSHPNPQPDLASTGDVESWHAFYMVILTIPIGFQSSASGHSL